MKKQILFFSLLTFLTGLGYAQAPCPSITLPYTEDFENYSTGELPPCWSKPVAYQFYADNYPAVYNSGGTGHFGNGSLAFYSAPVTYAVTPAIDEDIHNVHVTFWLKRTADYTASFQIGVMSDPNNISTFELVETAIQEFGAWVYYAIHFDRTTLTGTNLHIAFKHTSSVNYYAWYLDDITILNNLSVYSLERIYEYDASGNRICRKVLMMPPPPRMGESLSGSENEGEEPPIVEELVYTERVGNIRLTVFPNPTTQTATVRIKNYADFTEGSLQLFTPNGQLLQQHTISSSEFTIDLSNCVTGTYMLKLQMGQHSDTWKIIKQ